MLEKQEKKRLKRMQEIYLKRRQERMQANSDLATGKTQFTQQSIPVVSSSDHSFNSKTGDTLTNERLLWTKFEKEWTSVLADAKKRQKH